MSRIKYIKSTANRVPGGYLLLALSGKNQIGSVSISPARFIKFGNYDETNAIFMEALHVDTRYRHQGIGSQLIRNAQKQATVSRKCIIAFAKADDKNKQRALEKWYKLLGFNLFKGRASLLGTPIVWCGK